jgi:hypothetical protein
LHLVQEFIARTLGWIAGAGFFLSENRKGSFRGMQDACDRLRNAFRSVVKTACTPDPKEHVWCLS